MNLDDYAMLAGWATPMAQPANSTPENFLRRKQRAVEAGSRMGICLSDLQMQVMAWVPASGPTATLFLAGTARSGVLNPAHSRWLMGYHATWDECSPEWKEWTLLQSALALQGATGSGVSKDTEMP